MTDAVKSVCEHWISAGYGEDCFWENWPDCPCEDSLTPNQVMAAVTKLENENQRMREAIEKIASTGRCDFAEVRALLRSMKGSHD